MLKSSSVGTENYFLEVGTGLVSQCRYRKGIEGILLREHLFEMVFGPDFFEILVNLESFNFGVVLKDKNERLCFDSFDIGIEDLKAVGVNNALENGAKEINRVVSDNEPVEEHLADGEVVFLIGSMSCKPEELSFDEAFEGRLWMVGIER
jgi:hypothetical protein